MPVTLAAPALRLTAPRAWTVADPTGLTWLPGAPDEEPFGVLAGALVLDTVLDGVVVRASASVVVARCPGVVDDEVPAAADLSPVGEHDIQVAGRVDLDLGPALRVQTFWAGPMDPTLTPGRRASVQYLVHRRGWVVTLTFDTDWHAWTGALVDAFDRIALRAAWIDPTTDEEHQP